MAFQEFKKHRQRMIRVPHREKAGLLLRTWLLHCFHLFVRSGDHTMPPLAALTAGRGLLYYTTYG